MNVYDIDTGGASLPATYQAAKSALAECSRIDECKDWADRASALASYAKQAQDSQLEDMARRIKHRAFRRAGELIRQIEPARGGDRRSDQRDGSVPLVSRKQAAFDAGLSERQMKQVQRMANVPEPVFERMLEQGCTATEIAEAGTVKKSVNRDEARKLMAAVKAYRDRLSGVDLEEALAGLGQTDVVELRMIIGHLDHIHDRIVTSR
jgi:hypothetical protein